MLSFHARLAARGAARGAASGSQLRQRCQSRAAERVTQAPGAERETTDGQELVLVLERRGEGWGEEVLPHASFVRRPNRRRDKRKDSGSVHVLLSNCGLAPDVVADVVARATAWRATPGGRQLLDRRKQLQVHRHGERVVTALLEAGVPRGTHLQALLTQWPHLLELDAAKDWERHFCCLAAHLHASHHGLHLTPASEEQTAWEDEQRERARLGTLDPSRMALLDGVCFDYGLVDRDWEERFDELVAFVLHVGHADVLNPLSGVAPDSLLGAWARRQLTLHSLGTLPTAVEARLRAIGLLPLHASGNVPAKDAARLGERTSAHAPTALPAQPGAPAAPPRTQPERAAKAPRRRQASHIAPLAAPA